jgi:NAD(P)H-dependent FMN reductase
MTRATAATHHPVQAAVIIGSTRQGRFAPTVANWFLEVAGQRSDMRLDIIDLADVNLPAVYPAERQAPVAAFVGRIEQADAYVVITPEYNHGYPACLKQAIDLPRREWHAKPVAFVSYGGMAGGLRAVEQLRQVFAELHAVTVRDTVSFHGAHGCFDDAGRPHEPSGCAAAAKTMLDQLAWWARALRHARQEHPYAA